MYFHCSNWLPSSFFSRALEIVGALNLRVLSNRMWMSCKPAVCIQMDPFG